MNPGWCGATVGPQNGTARAADGPTAGADPLGAIGSGLRARPTRLRPPAVVLNLARLTDAVLLDVLHSNLRLPTDFRAALDDELLRRDALYPHCGRSGGAR